MITFLPCKYEGLVPRIHVLRKAELVVVVHPGRQMPKDWQEEPDFEDSLAAPDTWPSGSPGTGERINRPLGFAAQPA